MDRNVELFMSIMKDLQLAKVWEPPTVYLDGSLGSGRVSHLAEIIRRHNVSVFLYFCENITFCLLTKISMAVFSYDIFSVCLLMKYPLVCSFTLM